MGLAEAILEIHFQLLVEFSFSHPNHNWSHLQYSLFSVQVSVDVHNILIINVLNFYMFFPFVTLKTSAGSVIRFTEIVRPNQYSSTIKGCWERCLLAFKMYFLFQFIQRDLLVEAKVLLPILRRVTMVFWFITDRYNFK